MSEELQTVQELAARILLQSSQALNARSWNDAFSCAEEALSYEHAIKAILVQADFAQSEDLEQLQTVVAQSSREVECLIAFCTLH